MKSIRIFLAGKNCSRARQPRQRRFSMESNNKRGRRWNRCSWTTWIHRRGLAGARGRDVRRKSNETACGWDPPILLQPDTNASHLRVGILSKRRQAPVPFSLLVSLPSRLSAIFPSIPAPISSIRRIFRPSNSRLEIADGYENIFSSVNFAIEQQVKVEDEIEFLLSSWFLLNV